jgi:putative tricarboxylic transport membrane protein
MMDKAIVACALLLAIGYAWMTERIPTRAFGDPLGPKAFPRILTAGLILSIVLLIAEMLAKGGNSAVTAPESETAAPAVSKANWVLAATVVFTGLFFFLFEPVGFVLSSSAYLLAMTMYFNPGRATANALVSLLLPIGCYVVFTRVLGVELPRGILPL